MAEEKRFSVYILASKKHGFLYTGVTSDLPKRIWQHREGVVDGHTTTYSIKRLVYFEMLDSAEAAFKREKQLKRWRRKWKDDLIEAANPDWNDLYQRICT